MTEDFSKIIPLFLPVFVFISSAVFIYFKGQNTRINRVFIIFVLAMAYWSLSVAFFYIVKTPAAMTFWGKIVYISSSFTIASGLGKSS